MRRKITTPKKVATNHRDDHPIARKQMRTTSRLRRRRRQNYILVAAAIGLLIFGVLMVLVSSSSPKPRQAKRHPQPASPGQKDLPSNIDLSKEKRLFSDGLALLKQNKYRQAEPVLRKAKDMLMVKREQCATNSEHYRYLDDMLQEVAQAHYQAQKNIRLGYK